MPEKPPPPVPSSVPLAEALAHDLRESRERLALAIEAADLGYWAWDPRDDLMTLSPRVAAIFGLPADQVITRTDIRNLVHPAERDIARQANERALREGVDYDMEYRVIRPDGVTVWVATRGRLQKDASGQVVRMLGVIQDITRRKEAERQRLDLLEAERAARTEAEKANRDKDEFLSIVSHELRTPLNAILGWSQVLQLEAAAMPELREGLAVIERNGRAQAQIIEDLLDMSRIISGKVRLEVQRVDLPAVIDAALASMQPAADAKGLRLQQVIDPQAGPVSGDPARLQQVVWNLLSNAIKFTGKGGRISLTLARVNSHVEIVVSDTGAGISPEFLPYVFDRFRQEENSTQRRHGGLGLGLAIVKNLVELHGGSIEARSSGLGEGATFRVSLPLTPLQANPAGGRQRHPAAGTPAEPAWASPDLRAVRVLVVDDDLDSRQLLKRLLEDCRAEVMMAGSAQEALAALDAARFDVVVSDIGMPQRDGYDFIRELRARPADQGGRIPAVALTAFARSEDRTKAMLAGFDLHIAKPVESRELCAVVSRLAGRHARGGA
jgi:PAS domain S-box-containing protein